MGYVNRFNIGFKRIDLNLKLCKVFMYCYFFFYSLVMWLTGLWLRFERGNL